MRFAVYFMHALFYAPFLPRVLAAKQGEPVKKAPGARGLVMLHMVALGVMYFGVGNEVFSHTEPYVNGWRPSVGAAIIFASGLLAAWTLWVFRSWRFSAELDAKHELSTDGPFRFMRHPIYLALGGLAVGTAIWLPDVFTLTGAILNLLAGDLRARAEEKLLTESFGEKYRDYMKRVSRFVPFIYVALLLLLAPAVARAGGPSAADRLTAVGLEVKSLDAGQRELAVKTLDHYPSPCGRAHSLYTSLASDKTCKRAPFAGRFVVFLAGMGLTEDEVRQHYEDRFVSPTMGQCKAGAPVRGDEKAPLEICEFSDYQCPHCKAAEPILRRLLDEYKGHVKLLFKNFPLSSHADARPAAAAAGAAGRQGKFWPMHDLLFEHQDKLGTADILELARKLDLDLKKWQDDLSAAGERVDGDRAEGLALHVDHTPTIYIAGREYKGPLRYDLMKDWVDEALVK